MGLPPGLAGDVGHVDPQLQEKVLVGFGIAPTQSRAVYHDVYDGVAVHHLVVCVVDEVGIHPQGLVILRGAPIDGGQAVCRPLVNLGLGGLPLGRVHGVHRLVGGLQGFPGQKGGLNLPGAGEPEEFRVIPVDGGDHLLDHGGVWIEVCDLRLLVLQGGEDLVVEVALLAGEGGFGVSEPVLGAGVIGRGFWDRASVGQAVQGELAARQEGQPQTQG